MSNDETLLGIVQSFHAKMDKGFADLREHIDGTIKDAKHDNDEQHRQASTRLATIESRQDKQDGAWKMATFVASIVAACIGWLISLLKH